MTPEQFKSWRKARYHSQAAAGEALGLSPSTIRDYERGHRSDDYRVTIPRAVALACSAIAHGLPPWPVDDKQ